jgi:hypothetical protein
VREHAVRTGPGQSGLVCHPAHLAPHGFLERRRGRVVEERRAPAEFGGALREQRVEQRQVVTEVFPVDCGERTFQTGIKKARVLPPRLD